MKVECLIWVQLISIDMAKKGFEPLWGHSHTKAIENFEAKKDEQAEFSPKFSDFGDVMKWLDDDI